MTIEAAADTEDLPGGWLFNQIGAFSYFNSVFTLTTTTHVEFVAQYTTRMAVSCYVEIFARAPFIPVYAVNWHRGKIMTNKIASTSEENVVRLVIC